jgi:anti-sigma B factor antagonist
VGDEARPSLDLRIRSVDGVVVLAACGELDALTAPQLADAISTSLMDTQTAAVVVDLLDLQFLASACMTVLLDGHRTSSQLAKRFGVVADGPGTSRPMKIVGLDRVLTLHATLKAALSSMGKQREPDAVEPRRSRYAPQSNDRQARVHHE